MKVTAVILGVLGGVILSAFGQGDVWVGELRLQLAQPPVAVGEEPAWIPGGDPVVVVRLLEDGSVRSRFVLGHLLPGGDEREEDVVVSLADGMAAFLKTGKDQDLAGVWRVSTVKVPSGNAPPLKIPSVKVPEPAENGVVVEAGVRETVTIGYYGGRGRRSGLSRNEVRRMEKTMRFLLKRAKAFRGADLGFRRDAIRKLEGPVLEEWRLSFEVGSVNLGEFGDHRVWVNGSGSQRMAAPRYLTRLAPLDAERTPVTRSMDQWTFEALGRVPDDLARGKTVRWEFAGRMLRAFPENKAIYFRPAAKKGEDVRISLETAQEAWKMMEKRDRLVAWLEKEVEPGVEALLEKGE